MKCEQLSLVQKKVRRRALKSASLRLERRERERENVYEKWDKDE